MTDANTDSAKPFATFTLPSGRVATVRREPMGGDLEKAFDVAGKRAANPVALSCAMFAQVGEIDGKPVVYEDIRDSSALDALAILGWMNGARGDEGDGPLS